MRWSEPTKEPFGSGQKVILKCLEPTVLLEWGGGKINIYKTQIEKWRVEDTPLGWKFIAEVPHRNQVASEPLKVCQRCMWCHENDIPQAISELRKYFLERIKKNEVEYIRTKQRMNDLLSELDVFQDKMEGEA